MAAAGRSSKGLGSCQMVRFAAPRRPDLEITWIVWWRVRRAARTHSASAGIICASIRGAGRLRPGLRPGGCGSRLRWRGSVRQTQARLSESRLRAKAKRAARFCPGRACQKRWPAVSNARVRLNREFNRAANCLELPWSVVSENQPAGRASGPPVVHLVQVSV